MRVNHREGHCSWQTNYTKFRPGVHVIGFILWKLIIHLLGGKRETAAVWGGGVGWLPSNIRLGHAAGLVRLSEISLRVSHVFRPVIVRSPSDDDTLFFRSHILFWRPATLHARPSRIHYLVKEENGLSINVNASPLKRNGKKDAGV